MLPILEELKALMKEHNLSPATAAGYVGCSEGSIYNWIIREATSPGPIYLPRIRAAIRKIRREFEGESISMEINRYYRAVWPKLTRKEKDEILSLLSESGAAFQPAYLKRLKDLAVAHHVKVEDVEISK